MKISIRNANAGRPSGLFKAGLVAALLLIIAPAHADWKDKLKSALGDDDESAESAEATDGLSADQRVEGLKQALSQGVTTAIETLGVADGFWADDAVRIPLPDTLQKLEKAARKVGADRYVDEFHLTLNRAAETAVPAAAGVFGDAIREMTVEDAMTIIRGPEDAATQYFRQQTEAALREQFAPIVQDATETAGVTSAYKQLQKKSGGLLARFGRSDEDVDLDRYVTDRALDGLFVYVAAEEKRIRENPVARTTDLLKALFGG